MTWFLVVEVLCGRALHVLRIYYYILFCFYTHTIFIHIRVSVCASVYYTRYILPYCVCFFFSPQWPATAATTKTGVSARIRSSLVSVALRAARALAQVILLLSCDRVRRRSVLHVSRAPLVHCSCRCALT